MTKLKKGNEVWVACKVKPGPFPNERMVVITQPMDAESYVGFADVQSIQDQTIKEGNTYVRAYITDINETIVIAAVDGHALGSRYVQVSSDEVHPVSL